MLWLIRFIGRRSYHQQLAYVVYMNKLLKKGSFQWTLGKCQAVIGFSFHFNVSKYNRKFELKAMKITIFKREYWGINKRQIITNVFFSSSYDDIRIRQLGYFYLMFLFCFILLSVGWELFFFKFKWHSFVFRNNIFEMSLIRERCWLNLKNCFNLSRAN